MVNFRLARWKQKRFDCRLLTLTLIVDELCFIKYSRLYPGNQKETQTLAEMIKSLCTLRPDLAKSRTVIMDAGIASEDNIAYLKQPLFHYIGVNRSKADFTPIDTSRWQSYGKKINIPYRCKRRKSKP